MCIVGGAWQFQYLVRVECSSLMLDYCPPPLVVPSEDSHQSEYIAPCDARRGELLALGISASWLHHSRS